MSIGIHVSFKKAQMGMFLSSELDRLPVVEEKEYTRRREGVIRGYLVTVVDVFDDDDDAWILSSFAFYKEI